VQAQSSNPTGVQPCTCAAGGTTLIARRPPTCPPPSPPCCVECAPPLPRSQVTDLGIAKDTQGDVAGCLDAAIARGVDVLITTGVPNSWRFGSGGRICGFRLVAVCIRQTDRPHEGPHAAVRQRQLLLGTDMGDKGVCCCGVHWAELLTESAASLTRMWQGGQTWLLSSMCTPCILQRGTQHPCTKHLTLCRGGVHG